MRLFLCFLFGLAVSAARAQHPCPDDSDQKLPPAHRFTFQAGGGVAVSPYYYSTRAGNLTNDANIGKHLRLGLLYTPRWAQDFGSHWTASVGLFYSFQQSYVAARPGSPAFGPYSGASTRVNQELGQFTLKLGRTFTLGPTGKTGGVLLQPYVAVLGGILSSGNIRSDWSSGSSAEPVSVYPLTSTYEWVAISPRLAWSGEAGITVPGTGSLRRWGITAFASRDFTRMLPFAQTWAFADARGIEIASYNVTRHFWRCGFALGYSLW